MKKRIFYLLAFVILLAVEILIALFVHDGFVRPHVGDALVVLLLVALLRIIFPEGVRLLPLYVFLFAAAVEVVQLFDPVTRLGLSGCTVLRIAVGSTFDPLDLLSYAVGCALAAGAEAFFRKKK